MNSQVAVPEKRRLQDFYLQSSGSFVDGGINIGLENVVINTIVNIY